MTLRVSIIGLALIAMTAGGARAQQQAAPSIAEVARQAEAAKATVKKAKRSYTNADLSSDPRGEPAPAAAPSTGVISNAPGKPVTNEALVAGGEEKVDQEAIAAQSEEKWRGRAAGLRAQIEKMQTRYAMLTKPNPARDANPAAKERNDGVVAAIRSGLDMLRKDWARLEDSARETKIPTVWLDPRPQFQQ